MEEAADKNRSKGHSASRGTRVALAVLIVAVVVLSGISISYYSLSKHYYDAKYKAQYEIVSSLIVSLGNAMDGISWMINDTFPTFSRLDGSEIAKVNLDHAERETVSIAVMYPRSSLERNAFENLSGPFGWIGRELVGEYRDRLFNSVNANSSYVTNETVKSRFLAINAEISRVVVLLNDGIDGSVDWDAHPYSLVKRMDLQEIEKATKDLADAGTQLWQVFISVS